MANWRGYFIRATKTNEVFPMTYIQWESYSTTPNQREELKAYRDENTRNLIRVTAAGKKTVFSFKTRNNLHLADREAIQNFFNRGESNNEQRRIPLEYWDDEKLTYQTGDFYRPNTPFTIKRVTSDDIIYKEMTLEFIEY